MHCLNSKSTRIYWQNNFAIKLKFQSKLILGIAIVLFFCTSSFAQTWEQLYPDYPVGKLYSAKRVIPASNGAFHVLISGENSQLMKIDADGVVQTTISLEGTPEGVAVDMLKTANEDIIVLMKTTIPQNNTDINFLRYDADYNLLQDNLIGTITDYEQPRDIIELSNGEFWMVGLGGDFPVNSFLQKLDAQGQEIGPAIYDGFGYFYAVKILPRTGGGARVMGYGKINGTGNSKGLINEYDHNGNFINQLVYEFGGGQLLPSDIIETSDGGLLLTAFGGNGASTPVLIKTDNLGVELWRQEYTASGSIFLSGVKENSTGTAYRLLYRESTMLQHSGIIETDLQGNWIWKKKYSTSYTNEGEDLLTLPDNGALLVGYRHRQANLINYINESTVPYIVRTNALGETYDSAIVGIVANDDTDDCIEEGIDLSIGKFVTAYQDGFAVASAQVNVMGLYVLHIQEGTYKLAVELPNFLWSSCQDSLDITINPSDTIINQDFVIAYNNEPLDSIYGYTFEDYDYDCVRDSFETVGYEGWIVGLDIHENGMDATFKDTTDASGYFAFTNLNGFTNGATALIYFQAPIGTGLTCGIPCWEEQFIGGPFAGTSFEFNNGMHCDTLPFCPIMSVSIATDEIRPCLPESYHISYCNIGGYTADDAYVEVTIDSALNVTGSSIPWDTQVGNVYTFEFGDLLSNECGSIEIDFVAPCNDSTGTTYCSEVYAYPDSTCVPPSSLWDGSEIELNIVCDNDSLRFQIQNIGTGNMSAPLEYIVIEDNVLLYAVPQTFQLDAGQSMEVAHPAVGFFYHMQSEQPEGFPGFNTPVTWIEGCGSSGTTNFGLINQYPLGDEDTWQDIFCLESTNSYDPNDKNGFPRGVGVEHYIDQNQALEYIIRFQNTGTAEALYVEIRDTFPVDLLNPLTIRPGASSHSYTWDMEANGVIVFRFENINLDYEASDVEASKGFIQFKVQQNVDLPIGTQIKNTAAIYFDNNAPIITNQTLHTIGEDYLLTSWIKEIPLDQLQEVLVFPNPVKELVHIEVKDLIQQEELKLELYDVLGKKLMTKAFKNKRTTIETGQWVKGTYFFKVYNRNQLIGIGKILKL